MSVHSDSSARLNDYVREWSLESPSQIAETKTSQIFRVGFGEASAILKILTAIGADDEKFASHALANFRGHGAVKQFRYDEGAQLLEDVGSRDLSEFGDELATDMMCIVLNKLHKASHEYAMPELSQRFASLTRYRRLDGGVEIDRLCQRACTVVDQLLRDPREPAVLHGDMHHENVLKSSTRGWVAIDPKGLYGERAYDVANIFLNPHCSGIDHSNPARIAKITDIVEQQMGLNRSRVLRFAFVHACLSACWSIEDDEDPRLAISVASVLYREFL